MARLFAFSFTLNVTVAGSSVPDVGVASSQGGRPEIE
jgi:hypothetical protein